MEEEAEEKWMWKVGSEAELGSLKWPPRCYCCSFCGREFRSAQALGGHMNVHRRDRAKLKHNLDHVPISHCNSRGSLITRVAASSSPSPSSSSGSGFEGELVLKKQKLCVDFTMQISTEKEGDQDRDGLKQSLQTETLVEMKEAATEEFDLELRL